MKCDEMEVAPGVTLYVMAGAIGPGSGTVIAIPLDIAEQASSDRMAEYVGRISSFARLTEAIFLAERLVSSCNRQLPTDALVRYQDDIEKIERFATSDPVIDRAIAMINEARERASRRAEIPRLRRDIQANYSRLFMLVGRRDGFRCAICGSSGGDLQIDHVVALVNGGDNDPENLQLLCASCNARKSDRM